MTTFAIMYSVMYNICNKHTISKEGRNQTCLQQEMSASELRV